MEKVKEKALPLFKIFLVGLAFYVISYEAAFYVDMQLDKLFSRKRTEAKK